MTTLIAFFLLVTKAYAVNLPDRSDPKYVANKIVLEACLKSNASQSVEIGCVDAVQYMNLICKTRRDSPFKNYKKTVNALLDEACDLTIQTESHWTLLFDLDSKACRKGFESTPDRIVSLRRHKQSFEDDAYYMYEKNSCKEFRNYVNLCVYIDGQLKNTLPVQSDKLPQVEYGKNINDICRPPVTTQQSLTNLNYDLAVSARSSENNIYKKVIEKYRARIPSGEDGKSPLCERVRSSYYNLGCEKFEVLNDGEPIYFTAEEIRRLRIERQPSTSKGGRN